MLRCGQLIGLKPEQYESYKKYHAAIWPEIAEKISEVNIRNYSIYHRDGLLFSYFEYVGDDFDKDMAKMAEDPKTLEWWDIMKPLQSPLDGRKPGEWWSDMEEVFHQD
ncbi:MAG: L-rhamnose mutarotase [Spirochaetes bacterium]|nr:MAG: L-rhamnose mutarotase [Spirochaetota bacterium]